MGRVLIRLSIVLEEGEIGLGFFLEENGGRSRVGIFYGIGDIYI